MKQAVIYSLKIWLTTIIGLLFFLPIRIEDFKISAYLSELFLIRIQDIGLGLIMALLFSLPLFLVLSISVFWLNRKFKRVPAKVILSVIAIAMVMLVTCIFFTQYYAHPLTFSQYCYMYFGDIGLAPAVLCLYISIKSYFSDKGKSLYRLLLSILGVLFGMLVFIMAYKNRGLESEWENSIQLILLVLTCIWFYRLKAEEHKSAFIEQ